MQTKWPKIRQKLTDLNQFMNVSNDDKFKIPKLPSMREVWHLCEIEFEISSTVHSNVCAMPIKRTAPKVSVPAVKVAKTSGNALGLGAYSDSSDESD